LEVLFRQAVYFDTEYSWCVCVVFYV